MEEHLACALAPSGEILPDSVVLCENKNGEVFQVSIGPLKDKSNDVVTSLALGVLSCTKLKGNTSLIKKISIANLEIILHF